jgi:2'-5' RNA ligase
MLWSNEKDKRTNNNLQNSTHETKYQENRWYKSFLPHPTMCTVKQELISLPEHLSSHLVTDCIGSFKSNYHTITMAPCVLYVSWIYITCT